jgi:BNR repeat-like domain
MRRAVFFSVPASLLSLALALVAAGFPALATASPYKAKNLKAISGPSPFAAGCPGALFDDTNITGYELEPALTVNPKTPRNIIASWKQDAGPVTPGRTDLVASSRDGGKTWKRSTIPGLTVCTGGTADAASDPWLSAGPDGTVYFIGAAASFSSLPPPVAFLSSRSRNGGRTWSRVATVASPDPRNDKPEITADPRVAGRAYAIWSNWDHEFIFPFANQLRFSRTDDGGRTWSDAAVIDSPPPNAIDLSSVILVLPNGTLLAVFQRQDFFPDFTATQEYMASRSSDGGRTWSPPVEIATMPIQPLFDPETGDERPQPGFHSAAVARDGTIYVTWERAISATSGAIDVARSRDGGRTWRVAALPGVRAFAFEPAVAVNKDGTVGMIWYDLRRDRPGDAALTADLWFAHSHNRGRSWRQTHVAGPTDLRTAPLPRHNYFGEYQGLAALRRGAFATAFTLASPQAKDGPTDIFFARIEPRKSDDD